MPRLPKGAKARSGPIYMKRTSATTAQAIRVGGYARPSKSGELKFNDTLNTLVTLNSGTMALGALLNGLVPGSGANNRIGRKIVMKSVLIRYSVSLQATTTGGGTARIMLVYDKQANAAAPGVTDLLLSNTFTSPNNISNKDRFVVLSDIITESMSTQNNFSISGKFYKKLNLETMYNTGTAGTIADITTGSLYVFLGNNGGFSVAQPQITYETRIRFTDL